ncbi:hypothetical protein HHL22_02620 [Hymenobacter sp. RP-2-7]|uniref:Uncharacterized protein n=1 Tax=Hymenobacter polaris TaxID=2682546 RepID=A0A7Y0AB23_9BACT|nr:hypothetical protein [Hymenobacter polaris]NML64089.1 hypothetical protein [Hymenobacter polaris]
MAVPSLVRSTRGWLLAAGLAGGGWLAGSCSGAHEPTQHGPEAGHLRPEIKPTTNVPVLLGKSIEELRQRLGPAQPLPSIFTDLALYDNLAPQPTDSVMVFRTGGLLLMASYNIHSRHVNDLLLFGRHEDSLMHRATLRADAPSYLIVPLFHPKRPGTLLGLRVIPAERQ